MSQYRQKLLALLRDLFQFDSADLDFGIYAVMNHKRDQVERFIQHDLLDAPSLAETEAEKQWLQGRVLADVAYDLLYINGESALPDALPIEPEFKRLMFS